MYHLLYFTNELCRLCQITLMFDFWVYMSSKDGADVWLAICSCWLFAFLLFFFFSFFIIFIQTIDCLLVYDRQTLLYLGLGQTIESNSLGMDVKRHRWRLVWLVGACPWSSCFPPSLLSSPLSMGSKPPEPSASLLCFSDLPFVLPVMTNLTLLCFTLLNSHSVTKKTFILNNVFISERRIFLCLIKTWQRELDHTV